MDRFSEFAVNTGHCAQHLVKNTQPFGDTSGNDCRHKAKNKAKIGRFDVYPITASVSVNSPTGPVEDYSRPIQDRCSRYDSIADGGIGRLHQLHDHSANFKNETEIPGIRQAASKSLFQKLIPAIARAIDIDEGLIRTFLSSLSISEENTSEPCRSEKTIKENCSTYGESTVSLISQAKIALLNDMDERQVTSCAVIKNTVGDSIVCIAKPGQTVEEFRSAQSPLLFYVKTGSHQGQERLGTFYESYQLEERNDQYLINPKPRLMKVQEFRFQALDEAHNLKNQQGSLSAGISCSNYFYIDMMKLPGKSMDELDCHNWNIGKKLKFGLALLDYADSYTSYGMSLPDLNFDNIRYDPAENQIHFIDATQSGQLIEANGGADHEHGLLFAA